MLAMNQGRKEKMRVRKNQFRQKPRKRRSSRMTQSLAANIIEGGAKNDVQNVSSSFRAGFATTMRNT